MDRDEEDTRPLLSANKGNRKRYHSTEDSHSSPTDVRDQQENGSFAMDAEGRFEKPIEDLPSVEIRSPGERVDTARPQEDRQGATSDEQHQLRLIPEGSVSEDQEQLVETRQPIHEDMHAVEADFLTYIDNRDYGRELYVESEPECRMAGHLDADRYEEKEPEFATASHLYVEDETKARLEQPKVSVAEEMAEMEPLRYDPEERQIVTTITHVEHSSLDTPERATGGDLEMAEMEPHRYAPEERQIVTRIIHEREPLMALQPHYQYEKPDKTLYESICEPTQLRYEEEPMMVEAEEHLRYEEEITVPMEDYCESRPMEPFRYEEMPMEKMRIEPIRRRRARSFEEELVPQYNEIAAPKYADLRRYNDKDNFIDGVKKGKVPVIEDVAIAVIQESYEQKITDQVIKFYSKECKAIKTVDNEYCGCGKAIESHSDEARKNIQNGDWNSSQDTTSKDSHPGTIYFHLDETTGNRALPVKFLRLADNTDMKIVVEYNKAGWPLNYKPDIVISFLGGCGEQLISKECEDALKAGLYKILNNHDTIFLTRASNTGLSRLVGNICTSSTRRWKSGYVNKCVGIMPWGCVAGREQLQATEKDNPTTREPVEYNTNQKKLGKSQFYLDPNHHEFFLVDDGSEGRFGAEFQFRSKLQQYLMKENKIPSVNVVLGGGLSTIKAINESVNPKNDEGVIVKKTSPYYTIAVPVVILKHSGKAADVLADAIQCIENHPIKTIKTRKYQKYQKLNLLLAAKSAFARHMDVNFDPGNIEETMAILSAVRMICECVENRANKIFIFDVKKTESDLQNCILEAALKGIEAGIVPAHQILRFAMEGKNIEYSKKLLHKTTQAEFYPMDDALCRCNPDTVDELLEQYGFNTERYVSNKHTLKNLCGQNFKDSRGERIVIERYQEKHEMKDETKDIMLNDAKDGEENDAMVIYDFDSALKELSSENMTCCFKVIEETAKDKDDQEVSFMSIQFKEEIINPTQALIINRVIVNQPSTVQVFWHHDKFNPLSNALMVYTLQNGIINSEAYEDSVPEDLKESSNFFETKIMRLLNMYYETDKDMTEEVLNQKIPMWKNQTLVEVAGDIGMKPFIETPACQLVLAKAWKGEDVDRKGYLESQKELAEKRCCFLKLFSMMWYLLSYNFGTPNRKLSIHVLMYVISVAMFSYHVLIKNNMADSLIKWIMFIMVSALALDEFRQVVDVPKTWKLRFKQWYSSPWNILDLMGILTYYAGFLASFFHPSASKIIFSIFLFIWCVKFTQFLRVSSTLGPYMVMIFEMLAHMRTFLAVVFISVLGYGVFMTALLFPNEKPNDWNTIFHVIFRPYLLVFGELGLDKYELASSGTVFGTNKVGITSEIMVIIGMAVFLLFANVLLLNLLIAAFSNIYDDVQAKSHQIWRYEEYILLKEFQHKPVLPFPFSIPENLYMVFKNWRQASDQSLYDKPKSKQKAREIAEFERFCMSKLLETISMDEEIFRCNAEVTQKSNCCQQDVIDRIEANLKTTRHELKQRVEAAREETTDMKRQLVHIKESLSELRQGIVSMGNSLVHALNAREEMTHSEQSDQHML